MSLFCSVVLTQNRVLLERDPPSSLTPSRKHLSHCLGVASETGSHADILSLDMLPRGLALEKCPSSFKDPGEPLQSQSGAVTVEVFSLASG